MFYQLPPVGNPICLSESAQPNLAHRIFGDAYQSHYYASGTAALAAAIMAAVRLKAIDKPEVILPAYGCPDLVSAAVFAGAKPVLVDFEADRPWIDLEQLSLKANARTVAIIAVNLFGIPERLEQLRSFADQSGVVLIEDSAQAFPCDRELDIWQGDMVVLSFGRGKPVSLLGGGAVLCRKKGSEVSALGKLLPLPEKQAISNTREKLLFRLKAVLYNLMISPRLYWIPQHMSFLHLGETAYNPLSDISAMDDDRLELLDLNIKKYHEYDTHSIKLSSEVSDAIDGIKCIVNLPVVCGISSTRRLLRYPLLLPSGVRDRVFQSLKKAGLGPSLMYISALAEIPGLEKIVDKEESFPYAANLASRLLTLPLHHRVRTEDVQRMKSILTVV